MKRITFLSIIILLSGSLTAQVSSRHDSIASFIIHASAGYTTFALGDVRDFYNGVLEVYSESGLQVPTQKDYPGNVVFGISGMYNIPSVLRVGLGSQYTWTKAYSGYKDYAGLLEINSKISLLTIEVVVERDIQSTKTVNIFWVPGAEFPLLKQIIPTRFHLQIIQHKLELFLLMEMEMVIPLKDILD